MHKIQAIVEGLSDTGIALTLLRHCGFHLDINDIRIANGCAKLDTLIPKYRHAASKRFPWVVFRDADGKCPLDLRTQLEQTSSFVQYFQLRIVVNEIESWIMGDRDAFAKYFRVNKAKVPQNPDSLPNPKLTLLQLCSRSAKRSVSEKMTAISAGQFAKGPEYVAELNNFALAAWNPEQAAMNCPSLQRAISSLTSLQLSLSSPS